MPAAPTTNRDALLYTARRVAIAACLSAAITVAMTLVTFGTDPNALFPAGSVMAFTLAMSLAAASLLTGALSYRSAVMMRELNLARAELQQLSRTDQLTGLLNRRGFEEAAGSVLAKARMTKTPVVTLMCDIDRFKAINDRYGHEFGDRVLIQIAGVFRSFGEQNNVIVARHGGEEFAALMIGVSVEQAMKHANALRRACAAITISRNDVSTSVTISIGLTASENATDLSHMMRIADQALYSAKNGGRDRVERAGIASPMAA
jgi:diguanylate cyclase (GGDEF)-like protein